MAGGNRPAPTTKKYETAEWQANKFAALFLMPAHIVSECRSAAELVEKCQVSGRAAEIRMGEVETGANARRVADEVRAVAEQFKS